MWLRRLVGVVMIITLLGMNLIAILGLFVPDKKRPKTVADEIPIVSVQPTVSLTIDPGTITAGTTSALSWSTTGSPKTCVASGAWQGPKTPFGAESTGRISKPGTYTYKLLCTNEAGSADVSASLTVSSGPVTTSRASTTKSKSAVSSYCGGRLPCFGPKEVATHGGSGNCWGWNGDRVINISGFDAAYHKVKSGISSIEISSVCGKDLAPSLSGGVSAGGQTRNHNSSTKSNADKNEIPYFVGYFDSAKP